MDGNATFVALRGQYLCSAAHRYKSDMRRSERLLQAFSARRADVRSKSELARRAGLNAVTVRAYFNGEREPPLDACEALGRVLGHSGHWLFDGAGPRLLPDPTAPLRDGSTGPRLTQVPLLDAVTAGRLADPSSQIPVHDVPLLAFADLGAGEFFATTVKGTSMDRVSPEGSVIIVNRRDTSLVSGRCYVFGYRGQTTYKRWQGGDPAYLEPYSTDLDHKPIFIKRKRDFEVIGRVKRTVLDL